MPPAQPRVSASGQGGGEVAGEPGEVGKSAPGGGCEAAAAVGDQLHPGAGVVGASEVALGFGQVVDGHLLQAGGEQVGVDGGGEPVGGAAAVLVLLSGQRVE